MAAQHARRDANRAGDEPLRSPPDRVTLSSSRRAWPIRQAQRLTAPEAGLVGVCRFELWVLRDRQAIEVTTPGGERGRHGEQPRRADDKGANDI